MILLTGATGFIGRAVLRRLQNSGYEVRILLHPSQESPNLPKGVTTDVSVAALTDERSIRAALIGIDTVIHLASALYSANDIEQVWLDGEGTRVLAAAAQDAGVQRLIFLSHIGADRSSAYPMLKAKALGEDHIRKSGVPYTIFRSAIVFGNEDHFTSSLAALARWMPFVLLLPGDKDTLIQPLWVEELATGLQWALENEQLMNRQYEIGGPEFLTLGEVAELILYRLKKKRVLVSLSPPVSKLLIRIFYPWLLKSKGNDLWVDYFSVNRTTELDTLPRVLGLQPSRMENCLGYITK